MSISLNLLSGVYMRLLKHMLKMLRCVTSPHHAYILFGNWFQTILSSVPHMPSMERLHALLLLSWVEYKSDRTSGELEVCGLKGMTDKFLKVSGITSSWLRGWLWIWAFQIKVLPATCLTVSVSVTVQPGRLSSSFIFYLLHDNVLAHQSLLAHRVHSTS